MNNRIEFYKDTNGKFRWRLVAGENGEILADSGQGYTGYDDCHAGALRVIKAGAGTYQMVLAHR